MVNVDTFEKVCFYMEEIQDNQFSLLILMGVMHLKTKMKESYGDVVIASQIMKTPIVCFYNLGHKILSLSWYNERVDDEKE